MYYNAHGGLGWMPCTHGPDNLKLLWAEGGIHGGKTMPKPARNRRPDNNGNGNGKSGGIMASTSPVQWVSFAVGMLGLLGYIYQLGSVNATIQSEFRAHKDEINRNFREDTERAKFISDMISENKKEFISAITRIDTTIGNMAKLQTEVEVIKVQLTQMNDTMKDIRRGLERAMVPAASAPTKAPKP